MYRSVWLSLSFLLAASPALAHGAPPAALAVLGWDAQGVSSVRLTEGLALRTPGGFRFVCAEAWGGDVFVPTSILADGEVVIAGPELFLIDADGRATPHPDQVGTGLALARNRDALFGLFLHDGKRELRRIETDHSELLYSSDEPFTLLAARDDTLSLMHSAQHTAVVQHLSLQGELRERVTWWVQSSIAYAELRATGDRLYAVVWGNTQPWVTLGRVTSEGYEPLQEARSSIAGPLTLADGVLVAIDGELEWLDASEDTPVQGPGAVNCLDSFAGQTYACVSEGLKSIDASGVGDALFHLATLREPDYQRMQASQRADCAFRWRDVREHVAMLPGASIDADAGTDAPSDEEDASTAQRAQAASGCSLRAQAPSEADRRLLLLALGALLTNRRVRRYLLSGSSSARTGS
jgi:hypothetical protein